MQSRSFQVTDRDLEIIAWVTRHRLATAPQIAFRFGLGRTVAYRRLRALVARGLLEHRWVFRGQPGPFLATRAGVALAEVALPPATLDLRTYRHDLTVVDLAIRFELSGRAVVTEREMRQREGAPSGRARPLRYAVQLPKAGGNGGSRPHFADLAVVKDGSTRAVEVELTPKRERRWKQILGAYVVARHLDGVTYYVRDARIEQRLAQLARGFPRGLIGIERLTGDSRDAQGATA